MTDRRGVAPLVLVVTVLLGCGGGTDAIAPREDPRFARGQKVYEPCLLCHALNGEDDKLGPHLKRIVGRRAGAVRGFDYSDALLDSGIVWDERTLAAYLEDPMGYLPGSRMIYAGLKDPDDMEALLFYLRVASGSSSSP